MTVSLNFRESAYAQETGNFPICLITIDHDDLAEPILLSTDPTERIDETVSEVVYGTTSRGDDYLFFPCSLKLPDDTDQGPGRLQKTFDNIGRDMIATIRSIQGRATLNVEVVMSDDVDTVEYQWPEFEVTNFDYDVLKVVMSAVMETLENESFPWGSYTPSAFPGLFRGL